MKYMWDPHVLPLGLDMGQVTTMSFGKQRRNCGVTAMCKATPTPRTSARLRQRRKRTGMTQRLRYSTSSRSPSPIETELEAIDRAHRTFQIAEPGASVANFPLEMGKPSHKLIFLNRLGLIPSRVHAGPPYLQLQRLSEPTVEKDEVYPMQAIHQFRPALCEQRLFENNNFLTNPISKSPAETFPPSLTSKKLQIEAPYKLDSRWTHHGVDLELLFWSNRKDPLGSYGSLLPKNKSSSMASSAPSTCSSAY